MNRKLKIGVVGILLLSIIVPVAISISNEVPATATATTNGNINVNANANAPDKGSIDQIIAQKKANDHPKPISDKVGKLDKNLSEKLTKAGPTEKIRVAIWVKDDGIQEIPRPDPSHYQAVNANANGTNISDKQKPLKDYLKSKNLRIIYASQYAPVVFAEVTKADINDLSLRDDVTLIQTEILNQAMIYSSVPTVLAPPVWNFVSGGVTVAVVEPDGISFANPYLNPGSYWIPSNPNIGSHATAVAGIIASTHPTYTGVAYKGPAILSANSQTFYDSDLMAASEWALRNGARILSNSWGAYTGGYFTPMTYYYDYIVKNYPYATVVFSAGNCGNCPNPSNLVAAPALGYNVISVGSFDDKGTGWIWADDIMSYFSSYGAASPHNDRKLPNVAAVGAHDSINGVGLTSTTISNPWIGSVGMGTSFSSPEVSGEASLLMSASPGLSYWPEGVRAIIMASADHNIEGPSIPTYSSSDSSNNRDGSGGINVLEAYKIAKNNGWSVGGINYNSFPWYGPNIVATQGQKIRVVFTWDSKSTGYTGADTLDADLDLFIQKWDGTNWVFEPRAGGSASWDNNYEIVEFNAPETGTYRAQVSRFRWDDPTSYNYYGYVAYIK